MAKNILIYSDGTGQVGGLRPEQHLSNIYKMYRASKVDPDNEIDPSVQIAFYDQGLGSGEREGSIFLHPVKTIKKLLSSALGSGININIVDCYEAILKHYEPGDRIYLFGFSRGAYTVRCVANVMNLCGIPKHNEKGESLPRFGSELRAIAEEAVFKVYEYGISHKRSDYDDEKEELGRRFREKYGSEGKGSSGESQGNVQPYFIGVFDTVAALGLSKPRKIIFGGIGLMMMYFIYSSFTSSDISTYWGIVFLFLSVVLGLYVFYKRVRIIRDYPTKGKFNWNVKSWGLQHYDRFLDDLVPYARHALSIDEERKNFPRVKWGSKRASDRTAGQKPVWLKQVWFSGNHSDIGGSYPEDESRLSDITLKWMIEQIDEVDYPIVFNKKKLNLFPKTEGMRHCEIKSAKESWWPSWWPKGLRFAWPKQIREIDNSAPLHPSVIERFEYDSVSNYGHKEPYRPESLKNHTQVKKYYSDTE